MPLPSVSGGFPEKRGVFSDDGCLRKKGIS